MSRLCAALCAVAFAAPGWAAELDLLFPTGEKGAKAARLRVEIADDKAVEAAWVAFLDKLLSHFDRDGNGSLSETEAKRVFPLSLPNGREVAFEFATADADSDGKVTPAEFRAFYRAHGFAPVTLVLRQAPGQTRALGDALFLHLDRNGDGKLSSAELRAAPALLKRLDEDEDEVLTAMELLGTNANVSGAKPAGLSVSGTEGATPDATLRVALGSKPTLTSGGPAFGLFADCTRLHVPGGACAVAASADDPAIGFRAAKGFYLAQFKAVGDKPVAKSVFEDDPTAQVLAGLFDAADRDGDGKLTRAELEAFFDLIELGIRCRVVVVATDRGRNLFDLLDANSDGRLDLDELTRAAKKLPSIVVARDSLERGAVPASYQLLVGRGAGGDSFGPVPFGAGAKPKPPAPKVARGPAWFRAQDKNGDGFVSAREFVGSPDLFAKLDTDGDGRISVEEAEAAKP